MVGPMIDDYQRALSHHPEVAQDETSATRLSRLLAGLNAKWSKRFADKARVLTDQMIDRTSRYTKKSLGMSLKEMSGGLTLKTPDMPAALYDRMIAATKENVALIKSIQGDYHGKIQGAVMRSIANGGTGAKTLFDEIQHTGQVTKSRAELIAVDQTRKVTSAMNTERMKAAGLRKFEWIHSGGGAEPRPLHVRYDGQTFDLDDPPIIDERTGERGMPGQSINCRCKARPVVDFTQYLDSQ